MLHGAIAGPAIKLESAAELVYEAASGQSFSFNPGEAFEDRVFVINFTLGRGVVTGSPSSVGLTVGGVGVSLFGYAASTPWGYTGAIRIPAGTDNIPVVITQTNGTLMGVWVWRIGEPGNPAKIVHVSSNTSGGTSDPLPASLQPEWYEPGTKVLVAGAKTSYDFDELFTEEWIVHHTRYRNSNNFSGGAGELQAGVGTVSSDAIESASVKATPANRRKQIFNWQIAPKKPDELWFRTDKAVLKYHLKAHEGCFSDSSGLVPCVDGAGVQLWSNDGNQADVTQATEARRPTWKTGGLNGYPYLECVRAQQQWLSDLAITQASGLTGYTGYVIAGVVEFEDLAALQPILGTSKGYFEVLANGSWRMFRSGMTFDTGLFQPNTPYAFCATLVNNTNARLVLNGTTYSRSQIANSPSGAQSVQQFLRDTANSAYFHGKLYELLVWQTTSFEHPRSGLIVNALRRKYGI